MHNLRRITLDVRLRLKYWRALKCSRVLACVSGSCSGRAALLEHLAHAMFCRCSFVFFCFFGVMEFKYKQAVP